MVISDLSAFERDYPEWELRWGIEGILRDIHDANVERWSATAGADGDPHFHTGELGISR